MDAPKRGPIGGGKQCLYCNRLTLPYQHLRRPLSLSYDPTPFAAGAALLKSHKSHPKVWSLLIAILHRINQTVLQHRAGTLWAIKAPINLSILQVSWIVLMASWWIIPHGRMSRSYRDDLNDIMNISGVSDNHQLAFAFPELLQRGHDG